MIRQFSQPASRLILVIAFFFLLSPFPPTPVQAQQVIEVGSEIDFPPYAILTTDGHPSGFSVELFQAVAKTMGLSVNFHTGPWKEVLANFKAGEYDLLPLVALSPGRADMATFTKPHTLAYDCFFIRKGSRPISSLKDAEGLKIIVMSSDSAHEALSHFNLPVQIIETKTIPEAMQLLAAGKHDAVLVPQLLGHLVLHNLQLENLIEPGTPIPDYHREFAFAVQPGNTSLRDKLEQGLTIVRATGQYDQIYEKWFGGLDETVPFPWYAVVWTIGSTLLLSLCVSGWVISTRRQKALLKSERALSEARSFAKTALDSVTDIFYTFDLKGKILYWNKPFAIISGYSDEELATMAPQDFVLVEDIPQIRESIKKTSKENSSAAEARLVTRDGNQFLFEFSFSALKDDQDKLIGFSGSGRDISARKEAEDLLLNEKAFLRSLIDSADDLIYFKDRNGIYLGCNKASEVFTGLAEEDQIGKSDLDFFERERAERIVSQDQLIITNSEPVRLEEWVPSQRNGDRLLETVKAPLYGADGLPIGLVGISRDITDRKRMETALFESEERFRQMFRNHSAVMLLINPKSGSIIDANLAAEKFYGYSHEELLASNINRINTLPADQVSQEMRNAKDEMRNYFIFPHKISNGEVRSVEVHSTPITVNNIPLLFSIIHDISARQKAEGEKVTLENQLHQAQKIESIGQLAGGIAHDFNNMLGVIIGHAELAQRKAGPSSPVISNLNGIYSAAKRSAELTRQLLIFARKQVIEPKVLNLNETVAGMLSMLQRLIGENIHLSWQPESMPWAVKVDPSQIDQIFANLCVNSRDAISGVGQITIKTQNRTFLGHEREIPLVKLQGDYVILSVEDDGCGMDKETKSRIFEPFFTTKGVGKGTGLGLATVYGAVKQNNGFIDVVSHSGQGTTFNIYFPRTQAVIDSTPELFDSAVYNGSETVLLVEDDKTLLEMTKEILEESGYTVLSAATPALALSLAASHSDQIDLMISDVIMPEMNGKELSVKLQPLHPEMQVIFMSGYSADIISNHGVIEEGLHFLQKPASFKNLTAMIRSVLDDH